MSAKSLIRNCRRSGTPIAQTNSMEQPLKILGYAVVLAAMLLASPALADEDDDYRAALFERFDVNADGRLSADEFGRIKHDHQSFGDADTNRDGAVDRFEFQDAPAMIVRRIY